MMGCLNIVLMLSSLKYNDQYNTIVTNITEANSINGAALMTITPKLLSLLGVTNELHAHRIMADVEAARSAAGLPNSTAGALSSAAAAGAPTTALAASSATVTPTGDALLDAVLTEAAKDKAKSAKAIAAAAAAAVPQCSICLESAANVRFDPCGHLSCCERCSANPNLIDCPHCRKRITARQKTFV